jgi:hypothetical protein
VGRRQLLARVAISEVRRLGLERFRVTTVDLGTPCSSALANSESPCSSSAFGAHYNYQGAGGKQFSGDRYKVLVVNESCSTARKWVAKLTSASPGAITADGANIITGGPMGWSCEGKGSTYTTHRPPTISGQCSQGMLISASKHFYWATSEA